MGLTRWVNAACSFFAILFLALRNHFKTLWENDYYNVQVQRESIDNDTPDFFTLDHSISPDAHHVFNEKLEELNEKRNKL